MIDVNVKLKELLEKTGWSEYKLAKESGLSESTVANIFRRNTVPSIATLEAICNGFGITLSQFFSEKEMVELTPDLKELFENWKPLTVTKKQAAIQMLKALNEE